jgi:tetratricopeptide (TPR) repeat protein
VETTADDLSVLVGLVRLLARRNKRQMAMEAKIHESSLSRYESAETPVERSVLAKLMNVAGLPDWSVESFFLPFLAMARQLTSAERFAADPEWFGAAFQGSLPSAAAMAGLAEFLIDGSLADDAVEADDRPLISATTTSMPNSLQHASDPEPVSHPKDATCWLLFEDLAVQLCAESIREAPDDAARALALARRALEVALLAPGKPAWSHRLQAYCWAFMGNALRVASDLFAAESCFATAWRLWRKGSSAPGTRLAKWRLMDLEASLRRDRRQFSAALDLLDRAQRFAPLEARARILLNRSSTFEQAGDLDGALAALREAASLMKLADDPRLAWGVHFNLVVLSCHLGRYEDAARELPALSKVVTTLANSLDELRFRWLSARVDAGIGRREEAILLLQEVQLKFAQRSDGYNAALVSLELAILYLEDQRIAEVETLAQEILWIFKDKAMHREAIVALTIFCQAVEAGAATVELARRTLRSLERPEEEADSTP